MDLLLIIATIWLAAAAYTDLKDREISNWLSFSLVAIALATRATQSIIMGDLQPITNSVTGLIIFFILANVLYYGKVFAGGDAKLLIAMGAVIPGLAFISNLLIVGSLYGLIYTFGLAITNRNLVYKELRKTNKKYPSGLVITLLIILIAGLTFQITILYLIAALAIFLYFLQAFVKIIEKSCLIKKIHPSKLTEGDWLIENIKFQNKTIKANFEGLTKKQILLLRKRGKKITIKYGIPFAPVFLIAFLLTIWLENIAFLFLQI